MLNVTTINRQSVGRVVNYYEDAADDYYAKEGGASRWGGKGAEALGLAGDVDPQRLAELLDGRINATTRLQRSPPKSAEARKERLAYDFTFSAPKGVTLQALLGKDGRIVAAHDAAVGKAMAEAERLAGARTTTQGKVRSEITANLVMAQYRHETTRARDPGLHTHAVVLNMTQRQDGKWRALTNDHILKQFNHLSNVYKAELATELQRLGYTIRHEKDGTFDLAHFTPEQVRQFSKRSEQIEARLARDGLTRETATGEQKDRASLNTRAKKRSVDRDELHAAWQAEAKAAGLDFGKRGWSGPAVDRHEAAVNRPEPAKTAAQHAREAVDFAIAHHAERTAVMRHSSVMQTAMRHALGHAGAGELRTALNEAIGDGRLMMGEPVYRSLNPLDKAAQTTPTLLTRAQWVETLIKTGQTPDRAAEIVEDGVRQGRLERAESQYTTRAGLERETAILDMERKGRGAIRSVFTATEAQEAVGRHSLSPEQQNAATAILSAKDRYIGVQGFAGTGKSHMLSAAIAELRTQGSHVTALAPYGSQKKALASLGIDDARTLAAFLKASNKKIHAGSVVLIDEAGVIPARQMADTMREIEAAGARAVFLGDIAQTKAIEAGRPFDQLQKAGMPTARLENIQRQKNPDLREAVLLAAQGDTRSSSGKLTDIRIEKAAAIRHERIAAAFAGLPADERAKTLIITGTNASRTDIIQHVRARLGLEGKGQAQTLLTREDSTQAERRHSRYFAVGSVIVPERDSPRIGLVRGAQYEVIDTGPGNRLTVRGETGRAIAFNPKGKELSVYSADRSDLAPGDRVAVTRNDKLLDVATGDKFMVQSLSRAGITMTNDAGRTITVPPASRLFLAHAYATTVHSSQGMTTDRVFLNLDSSSRTTTKDVYYVGISRARHEAAVFTDDRARMVQAIGRDPEKAAALDLRLREQQSSRQSRKEHKADSRQHKREDRQERRNLRGWLAWIRGEERFFRREQAEADRHHRHDERASRSQHAREERGPASKQMDHERS